MSDHKELANAYALASKGSKERALLLALNAGFDFTKAVSAFGDEGPKVAFDCILKGWISQGQLTDEGRAELEKGSDG